MAKCAWTSDNGDPNEYDHHTDERCAVLDKEVSRAVSQPASKPSVSGTREITAVAFMEEDSSPGTANVNALFEFGANQRPAW